MKARKETTRLAPLILLALLTIGTVHASPTITLSKIERDVSSIETLFHSIQLISRIKEGSVTAETVFQQLFTFGSNITLKTLADANFAGLEPELKSINQVFVGECGGVVGCIVDGNATGGIDAVRKLKEMAEIVEQIPNLVKLSAVKDLLAEKFKGLTGLTELADRLLEINNAPRSEGGNRQLVHSVSAGVEKVLPAIVAFRELKNTLEFFDKSEIASELALLTALQTNSTTMMSYQADINSLLSLTEKIGNKVQKLLDSKIVLGSARDKVNVMEQFDSSPVGADSEYQFLEHMSDNFSASVVKMSGVSKRELQKVLEPSGAVKDLLSKWLEKRNEMNPPAKFAEGNQKVKKELAAYSDKLDDLKSIIELKECIKNLTITTFSDGNLARTMEIDTDAGHVEAIKNNTAGIRITVEDLKQYSLVDLNVKNFTKHLEGWKNLNFARLNATLRDLNTQIRGFQSVTIFSTSPLLAWLNSTGISRAYKCSQKENRLRSAETIQKDLANLTVLKVEDPHVKLVLAFVNRLGTLIGEANSNHKFEKLSATHIPLPNFYFLATTVDDLAKVGRALRVMKAFEENEDKVTKVIKGMPDITSANNATKDIWTSDASRCVHQTLQGMHKVREAATNMKRYKQFIHWLPVLDALHEVGSCNSGWLFMKLAKIVKDVDMKNSLKNLAHIQLTYASAESTDDVLKEVELYFAMFQKQLKYAKDHEEKNADDDEGSPLRSYIILMAVLILTFSLCFFFPIIAYFFMGRTDEEE